MSVISPPVALYNNLPINATYYQPKRYIISAISQGKTTTVTTSEDHDFVIGQIVRFIIPPPYGIRELNEQLAMVLSIPSSTQVLLQINSNGMNAFVAANSNQDPFLLPIGDYNSGQINPSRTNQSTNIPGSFINIS